MDTIARVRRAFHVQGWSVKRIVRELHVSRNTVRKILRSDETDLPAVLRGLCRQAGFEPRIVQTAREATTQIGLVGAGLGVAVLPAPLETVRMARVRYLPITDAEAQFRLAVATVKGAPSPLLQGFLDVVDGVIERPAVPS